MREPIHLKVDKDFNEQEFLRDTPDSSLESATDAVSHGHFSIIPREEEYMAKKARLKNKLDKFDKRFKQENNKINNLEKLLAPQNMHKA